MKMKRNPITQAVKQSLFYGVVASTSFATAAMAQDDVEEQGKITVTGSNIKSTDLETAAPVFSIDREEILSTGLPNVGDLLAQIPSAGATLNLVNNNGGNGGIQVDMRNLGSNRVLVLVNGRRWVRTLGGAADLTTIPVSIIERIDVLKDGASAIYGSDAIAGVINIVTRSDFEGVELTGYFGRSTESDGDTQHFSVSTGATSDRGSVFFNAEYVKIDPVFAGDREISSTPNFGTGNFGGSSGTPQGRFMIFTPPGVDISNGQPCLDAFGIGLSNCTTPAGSNGFNSVNDPDLIPHTAQTAFNFAPDNYLVTPNERTAIYTQAKYQITDNITLNVDALFNRRESDQLLAPTPLFFGSAFGTRPGVDIIDIGALNPYNPYGVDIPGTYIYLIGRRQVEGGNRIFRQENDTYHFGLGLEGFLDVGTGWNWSVNYTLNETDQTQSNEGELSMPRVVRALSNECVTDPTCVPLNLFGGAGTITQEMFDFISFRGDQLTTSKLLGYQAIASTEFGGLEAGPIGFAAGYERRRASGSNIPDQVVRDGETSGNQQNATSGAYTVDEVFLEFNVPLLSGVAMAESLELSAAVRWSDYDVFGSDTNGKLGLTWRPNDELMFRATYAQGFRAPNINELFFGGSDSFPNINDPCSGIQTLPQSEGGGPRDANGNGIYDPNEVGGSDGNLVGCAGISTAYNQPNPQIRITVGSNPNLTPEESDSYTIGVVYEPEAIEGLFLTLDYYDIEIDNVITTLSAQTIINRCAQGRTEFCARMTRSAFGSITDVQANTINQDSLATSGFDFVASYRWETDYGLFRLVSDTSFTTDFELTSGLSGTTFDFFSAGYGVSDVSLELPKFESNLTLDWSYGDWSVNWQARHIGKHDEVCDPDLNDNLDPSVVGDNFLWCTFASGTEEGDVPEGGSDVLDMRTVGGQTIHDVNVTYHLTDWDASVTLGIENIFDKDPSLSNQAFANSYESNFNSGVGRFWYLQVRKRF